MSRPEAGDIVIVDWRVDARPTEPTKSRPAVVVEDSGLYPEGYPNLLVAPMTSDEGLAHRAFAVTIEPDASNGVSSRCWVLSHHVTSVSLERVQASGSHVSAEQLAAVRDGILLAVGG